jgi:two-component system cell cycle response regulator DivK
MGALATVLWMCSPAAGVQSMAGTPRDDSQPPLVLVVDDYQDTRDVYARFLALSGFRAEQAHNGHEAIKKTRALLPDVILLDLLMPGLDGWEVARRLKTDELTRSVPIIAVTADATPSRHHIAKKAGCDSVMIKPCAPDALLMEIRRVLKSVGSPVELSDPA